MMIVQQHVHSQQPHATQVSLTCTARRLVHGMHHHRHRHHTCIYACMQHTSMSSRSRSKAAPDCYIISMPLGDALGVCVCVAASRLAPVSRSNEGAFLHLNFRYSIQIPGAQPCFGNFSPRNFRGPIKSRNSPPPSLPTAFACAADERSGGSAARLGTTALYS